VLRAFGVATAALALTVSALSAGAARAAAQPLVLVAPHQYFQGLINGQTSDATIQMACLEPTTSGEMGHPIGGQTIGTELLGQATGPTSAYGYTGDLADSIVAQLINQQAAAPEVLAQFEYYGTQALSTSLTLPCAGTGVVDFVPAPDSAGQAYPVMVQFAPQPGPA
jgi:hypothetical protein